MLFRSRLALAQVVVSRVGQLLLGSADRADSTAHKIGDLLGVEFPFQQQLLNLPALFDADQTMGAAIHLFASIDGYAGFVTMGETIRAANRWVGSADPSVFQFRYDLSERHLFLVVQLCDQGRDLLVGFSRSAGLSRFGALRSLGWHRPFAA